MYLNGDILIILVKFSEKIKLNQPTKIQIRYKT